jgi:hypothetical protein
MKRDMDMIRRILLHVEQAQKPVETVPDCAQNVFDYHTALIIEAGLAEGDVGKDHNLLPFGAVVFRLTWNGHEFLDSARSDTVWQIAKQKVLKPGASWTFALLGEVLKTLAKHQLAEAGIPGLQPN